MRIDAAGGTCGCALCGVPPGVFPHAALMRGLAALTLWVQTNILGTCLHTRSPSACRLLVPCCLLACLQLEKGTWYDAGGKKRTHVTQYHSVISATTGLRWLGELARVGLRSQERGRILLHTCALHPKCWGVVQMLLVCNTFAHARTHTIHTHSVTHARTRARMRAHTHARTHACTRTSAHVNVCTCKHMKTYAALKLLLKSPQVVNIIELVGLAVAQIIASASNFHSLETGMSKRWGRAWDRLATKLKFVPL